MKNSEQLLIEILKRFKSSGVAHVSGYKSFGYIRETENAVFVTRETGKDTRVSFSLLIKGIEAYQSNPELYQSNPTALRAFNITHVTSPVFALLHLLESALYHS